MKPTKTQAVLLAVLTVMFMKLTDGNDSLAGGADCPSGPACRQVGELPHDGLFETTTVWPAYPNNRPNYRIPALITSPGGDLLAFAEKRNDGVGDLGNHDLVMKRSSDLGKTWSAERVLLDDGRNCSTDTTLAVDGQRRVIWLFFLRDKARYYVMSSAADGTIGMVYERGPQGTVRYWDEIQFARFDLAWLTHGADASP